MRILIVEDLPLVAERIQRLAHQHFPVSIKTALSFSLEDAALRLKEEAFDLLLLDLNLNGEDGFELLRQTD